MSQSRTTEQIRQHYEVEKELAGRLFGASREARRTLYSAVYNELFLRVPHHPQLSQKASAEGAAAAAAPQLRLLAPFLRAGATFLEIGPGDCAVALAAAERVKQVIAVDVSSEITKALATPANFSLILSDGVSIPVAPESIDLVYSHQLMEHLHPDDALDQLRNVYRALAPGGAYICVTPNRLSGPHDISMFFDEEATGFHLKEYTVTELSQIFRDVGFSKVKVLAGGKGQFRVCPLSIPKFCEAVLSKLPRSLRKRMAFRRPFRWFGLLNIRVIGWK